jgi:hypothetical protein
MRGILMMVNKKLLKKDKISKEIDKVNKIIKSIEETNKTIDYVSDTLILCDKEIIDKKNFSIMSLPSDKEFFRNI